MARKQAAAKSQSAKRDTNPTQRGTKMLKVGSSSVIVLAATLAGQPGSFEAINSVTLSDPAAGNVTISDDKLNAKVDWIAVSTGVTATVVVDNVTGDTVGTLSGTSEPVDIAAADVLTADALAVSLADPVA
jgi:hypothetical protein